MAADLKNAYATLKRRHKRFVDEYLLGKTAADAMRDIGFKGREPRIAACKLLARPEVRAAVEERRAVLCEAVGLRQEMVVREMMAIGFSDVRQLLTDSGAIRDMADLDEGTAKAIAGIEVEQLFEGTGAERKHTGTVRKVKLWDKVKALTDLSKIVGLDKQDAGTGTLGPGLTVIIQQVIGHGGQSQGPALQQRVVVDLPGPA